MSIIKNPSIPEDPRSFKVLRCIPCFFSRFGAAFLHFLQCPPPIRKATSRGFDNAHVIIYDNIYMGLERLIFQSVVLIDYVSYIFLNIPIHLLYIPKYTFTSYIFLHVSS